MLLITKKLKIFKALILALYFIPIIEASNYIINYFNKYPERSRTVFNASLVETLGRAFEEKNKEGTIFISESFFPTLTNQYFKPYWYSHILFFGKIDPTTYQQKGIPEKIVSLYNPEKIPSSGLLLRTNFIIIYEQKSHPYVIFNQENLPKNAALLYSRPFFKGCPIYHELYRF